MSAFAPNATTNFQKISGELLVARSTCYRHGATCKMRDTSLEIANKPFGVRPSSIGANSVCATSKQRKLCSHNTFWSFQRLRTCTLPDRPCELMCFNTLSRRVINGPRLLHM